MLCPSSSSAWPRRLCALLLALLALLVVAACSAVSRLPVLSPSLSPTVSLESQVVSFPSGDLTLKGYLWKPAGRGPFPAIVFNHGSEPDPKPPTPLAAFWLAQGYVLFEPLRRGQGLSLGTYILDQLKPVTDPQQYMQLFIHLMETKPLDDQLAGLSYLQAQPFADGQCLVVTGCSFGGIQTVLAAERSTSYRAGVDFAGGAESWDARYAQLLLQRMITAVQDATILLFFIQAQGDFNIGPTQTLGAAAQRAGKPDEATIYPQFGPTPQDNHDFCANGTAVWGSDVLSFLAAHGVTA